MAVNNKDINDNNIYVSGTESISPIAVLKAVILVIL